LQWLGCNPWWLLLVLLLIGARLWWIGRDLQVSINGQEAVALRGGTKVGFDLQAESPKLTFSAVGLLDDEGFAEVQEIAASDVVSNILGSSVMAAVAAEAAAPTEEVEEEAPAPKPAAKPKAAPKPVVEEAEEEAPAPKPAAKPKAKPAPVVDDMDLDLDGINFDD
jgi:pyruvate/2-oxoglutarate dehydrogenase complex dihydrolipoamide acyltransferase (E2) component